MADLSQEEFQIHEKVLKESAKSYLKVTTEDKIQANYGFEQKYQIAGKYPDLIVTFPSGEIVIEKIETESTVTESQLVSWRELASLGHKFNLIVPLTKIEEAKNLVTGLPGANVQAFDISGEHINWFGQAR